MNDAFIPIGINCYDNKGVCPHWEAKSSDKGLVTSSFCHYKARDDDKLNDKLKICNINLKEEK